MKAISLKKDRLGMTLVEILVATIALSIVVLAAGSVYLAGVRELGRSSDEGRIQIEASSALDHMYKNLMGAKGIDTITSDAIEVYTDAPGFNGKVMYMFNNPQKAIYMAYPTTQLGGVYRFEKIASYITSLTFARPLATITPQNPLAINNYVTIQVTTLKGRMQETISTGVALRGMPSGG